ncbi:KxYKxGKxW signal peptide domain-containing protein, partial [Liquorilactobacillus vini]
MEVKTHYKMYKAGKKWMFAAITAISLGAGLGIGTYTAQASSAKTDNA